MPIIKDPDEKQDHFFLNASQVEATARTFDVQHVVAPGVAHDVMLVCNAFLSCDCLCYLHLTYTAV